MPRNRSFGWGFLNEEEELTFTLLLSAADHNIAGRGLAAMLPVVEESETPPSPSPASPSSERKRGKGTVRRVLTIRLDKKSIRMRGAPGKRFALASLLFCRLLPVVGALVVMAGGFAYPRMLRPASVGSHGRGAVAPLQATEWSATEELEYARMVALQPGGLAAAKARLEELTRYETSNMQRCTQAMANQLHRSAAKELMKLTLHLSLLKPIQPCIETPSLSRLGTDSSLASFPHVLVGATGFARVAIEVLSPGRTEAKEREKASSRERDANSMVVEGRAMSPMGEVRDHKVAEGSGWIARGIPGGFDVDLALRAAELCGMTYHSTDYKPAEAIELLESDLAAAGLELVAEIDQRASEVYALLARNESALFVVFRGSATVKNVMTDIDYANNPAASLEYFSTYGGRGGAGGRRAYSPNGKEGGMGGEADARPWQMHGGFVSAYLSVRQELAEAISQVEDELDLVFTGHSMGGALALLAALDFKPSNASLIPSQRKYRAYTFAGPRLGDSNFAATFDRVYSAPEEHWALQAPSDAVPHLPFAAWGFQHPRGVFKLSEDSRTSDLSRTDRGDTVEFLRPQDGKMMNWASCHDIKVYSSHVRRIFTTEVSARAQPLPSQETPRAPLLEYAQASSELNRCQGPLPPDMAFA